MIIIPVKDAPQGSAAWAKARLGIPTASEFDKILTPGGDLSKQASKYCYRLIYETLTQTVTQDLQGLEHIENGKAMEPMAVNAYQFLTETETEEVGLILSDDREMGCSPDRLVGKEGCLEIKCPSGWVHIQYMIEGDDPKYKPQRQGQLLITDRSFSDFYAYNPKFPPVHVRTMRDEKYIAAMRRALTEFIAMKKEYIKIIMDKGYVAPPTPIYDPMEKELGEKAMEAAANRQKFIEEDYCPPC